MQVKAAASWIQFAGGTILWLLLASTSGSWNVLRVLVALGALLNTVIPLLRATGSKLLAENRRRDE